MIHEKRRVHRRLAIGFLLACCMLYSCTVPPVLAEDVLILEETEDPGLAPEIIIEGEFAEEVFEETDAEEEDDPRTEEADSESETEAEKETESGTEAEAETEAESGTEAEAERTDSGLYFGLDIGQKDGAETEVSETAQGFALEAALLDEHELYLLEVNTERALDIEDAEFQALCFEELITFRAQLDSLIQRYEALTEEEKNLPELLEVREYLAGLEARADALFGKLNRISFYADAGSPQMVAAEQKAWQLLNTYADPQYFLNDPYRSNLTDAQYAELQAAAQSAAAGAGTDYDKIKAITEFVADRTYYDYLYLKNKNNDTGEEPFVYLNPYEVYKEKRTVCAGYSYLTRTLLISLGIPCMTLTGDNHGYNAAFDGQRWVFTDATWCSWNSYTENREWIYRGYSLKYFDLAPEEIAQLSNHEAYNLNGLTDGSGTSAYYGLTYAGDWEDGNWQLEVTGRKSERVVVRNELGGLQVAASIGKYVFREDMGLRSIDLSALPLTSLEEYQFLRCGMLETVRLPASLEVCCKSAFQECTGLKRVDLSSTKVRELGEWIFYKCGSLAEVKLPDTLETCGKCAFYQCVSLKSVDLSRTKITFIGEHAFRECTALETAVLPATLKEIERTIFYNCSGLKTIDFSRTQVEVFPAYLFQDEGKLETVKFPAALKTIGNQAFLRCASLKEADLSGTRVEEIGDFAFRECTALASVKVPACLKTLHYQAFYQCSGLREIDLSGTKLDAISDLLFCKCDALTLVKFPASVKTVGSGAFNCSDGVQNKVTTVIAEQSAQQLQYKTANSTPWKGRKVYVTPYEMVKNGAGAIYFIRKGATADTLSGLLDYCGTLYYVEKGIVKTAYTGLVKYSKKLYYVKNGVHTTDYTGLVKYSKKLYYVKNGVHTTSCTGLVKYGKKLYYVKKGVRTKSYTGLAKYGKKLYYVKKGVHTASYTGLMKYGKKLYYVKKGVQATGYTGLVKYGKKLYYVKKGVHKTSFNGKVKYKGKTYHVKKGIAV